MAKQRPPLLWPCHIHPKEDELLSSWIVRLAHEQKMKVQTFSEEVFGRDRQIWNRDVDRLAPRWVVVKLRVRTGTTLADAFQTSLRAYRTKLYRKHRDNGVEQWMLPLDMWHRKHRGFGLQFCPACLAEGDVPYFRKRWRVAFYTVCTKHNCMVRDRCPECGSPIAYHRIDVGEHGSADYLLSVCHHCHFDLRQSPVVSPVVYDESSYKIMEGALRMLEGEDLPEYDIGFFDVLHQLCRIMTSTAEHIRLRQYVVEKMGIEDIRLQGGRVAIEERSLEERHHLVQLGMWLMADPERIIDAWKTKAVRYNVLGKDFKNKPKWYQEIMARCEDWRKGR